jgi:fumarylacetoacetate (FAA) hydrolase
MKFATLKDGSRDGKLVLVNRTLTQALPIPQISKTLQGLLDDWKTLIPRVSEVYQDLEKGNQTAVIPFNEQECESPLPRAYQWADGSAYLNHVELVRKARGAEVPESFFTDPLMYQGGSDSFLGPRDDVPFASEQYGADCEAEVAVIVDDVPMGASVEQAHSAIRLIMLVNDVSLRGLIPNELAKGFGFFHGKPSSAFSPIAVTPDELGDAWNDGKINLSLITSLNGTVIGRPNAGNDLNFTLPQLVAHAAKTRPLGAGTIIGSGTVSNRDRTTGVSCLAEQRMIETIESGEARTPFLKFGDIVRIEMFDQKGKSIFGTIEQKMVQYK